MFYGWRMVGVAFFAHMVASGLGFYAVPRLMVPLADEFAGGNRAGVALLTSAMSLAGVFFGPIVGQLLTRYRLSVVMPVGAVIFGLGFFAASRAEALWQLAIVYGTTVPIAVGALSASGANSLVGNWFERKRPLAIGVAQFGLSLSGAVVTFFVSWTLVSGTWRSTYLWFAGIALLSAPLLRWMVVDRPSDLGLAPDGDTELPPLETSSALPTLQFNHALRDRNLWLVGMAAGLCFSGTTAFVQNAHAFATDAGFHTTQADSLLACVALGAALGKIVFGLIGVRFGERASFAIAAGSQALMMLALPASRASAPLLLGVGLCFGIALGGIMPAMAALLARLYGPAGFGPSLGYIAPMLVPFQMVGAPIAAWTRDVVGHYDPALYGLALATACALLLLIPLRLPARAGLT